MKKLLGIVVLGLLLGGNAYSKDIYIKCMVNYIDNKQYLYGGEKIVV
jgi:hypothetical protein